MRDGRNGVSGAQLGERLKIHATSLEQRWTRGTRVPVKFAGKEANAR